MFSSYSFLILTLYQGSSSQKHKTNAIPGCHLVSHAELSRNIPLQFYCQGKAGLIRFPSTAAIAAWKAVRNSISAEFAISVLKRCKPHTHARLNLTLWSSDEKGEDLFFRSAQDFKSLESEKEGPGVAGLAVDIGSGLGASTIALSRARPGWTIISAEAMPATYLMLIVNLWLNVPAAMGAARIRPLFAAVGDGRPATFRLDPVTLGGRRDWDPSIPPPVRPGGRPADSTHRVTFPTLPLHGALRRAGIGDAASASAADLESPLRISLIRFACDGCEHDVLLELSEPQAAAVARVSVVSSGHGPSSMPPAHVVARTRDRLCRQWGVCTAAEPPLT